nr:c-type cytochrome [Sphingomonas rhizophila]
MIQVYRLSRGKIAALPRKRRVIHGDSLALVPSQSLRDPGHLRVAAAPIGISLQLSFEIAGIEAGQSRCAGPVAPSVETMTCRAGVRGAGARAAQRDDAPVAGEAVERCRVGLDAADEKGCRGRKDETAHREATSRSLFLFRIVPVVLLAACKPPPAPGEALAGADPANGKAVIERVGCGACHAVPGVRWPQGKAGPALDGLSGRALIAGKLANRPDVLSAYIRDAPAMVTGSAMPAMPVSEAEARDIAAYLYEQGSD